MIFQPYFQRIDPQFFRSNINSLLFGNALISNAFCVYGGIVASHDQAFAALQNQAQQLARELGVDYLEMRNRQQQHPDWPHKQLYVGH